MVTMAMKREVWDLAVPVVLLLGLLQSRPGTVVVFHCTATFVRCLEGREEAGTVFNAGR